MISQWTIERVLYAALEKGGDFAEVFVEDKKSTNIRAVGGLVEENISGRDYGIGIRIIEDVNSIYAFTNNLEENHLISLARQAGEALKAKNNDLKLKLNWENLKNLNPIEIVPSSVAQSKKVELLKEAYSSAKNYDDLISQVTTFYREEDQEIIIANTDGLYRGDHRIRTRFGVVSVASLNGEIQEGMEAPGRSMGFEFFDEFNIADIGREASRIATTMVKADYAPSGEMPVIIDNEFGGVLFHEACGHGLEAQFVARKTSKFTDKLGQPIASKIVTAIDDATIPNAWGTSTIDDEGTKTQRNVLIEDGVLKSYLIDKLNGKRMGMESTGSGRRESYKYAPTSRMNNTFIDSGDSTLDEIIANTENGIYAKKLGGGSVNISTGDFNFAVQEGYLVKNGVIVKPVRGATLIGNGAKVLERIDMVGNNLGLGTGMCGSSSGSIPAAVGQPPVRVSKLTVGGR